MAELYTKTLLWFSYGKILILRKCQFVKILKMCLFKAEYGLVLKDIKNNVNSTFFTKLFHIGRQF